MGVMRRVSAIGSLVGTMLLAAAPAFAQKKDPAPEGVKLAQTIHPDAGFVDDAYAFDGSGGRLAIVRADASTVAEIQVYDLTQKGTTLGKFDVSKATTTITQLSFTQEGNLLAISRPSDTEKTTAFLYDLTGKQLRKWGPATDIGVAIIDGVDVVTVFDQVADKPSKKTQPGVTYTVSVFKIADGKLQGKKRSLHADANGFIKGLDMTVIYWRDGYTELVGQKKGDYDKYQDQRQPDNEGVYDVVDGAIVKNQPINDLVAHQKIVKLRADRWNQNVFLTVTDDLRGMELVTADDKRVAVTTDGTEPFAHYDTKSLVQEQGRDGKLYFTLTIDPVNGDAVAKKVSDPERIDLWVVDAAGGTPTRLARINKQKLPFGWHVGGGHWAVLRKHKGYDRGGPDLELYDLTATK